MEQNELYHFGVQGMKWGVRKSVYKKLSRDQKRLAKKIYKYSPEHRLNKKGRIGKVVRSPALENFGKNRTLKKIKKNRPMNYLLSQQREESSRSIQGKKNKKTTVEKILDSSSKYLNEQTTYKDLGKKEIDKIINDYAKDIYKRNKR